MVCVFTDEVLWRKIIPLLSHKITPHFQLLPMYSENPKVISKLMVTLYEGRDARKPVFGGFANNKGADQPAHQRNLVSAFVIRSLESIIFRIALSEIFISIYLVCRFEYHFFGNLKTGFPVSQPKLNLMY